MAKDVMIACDFNSKEQLFAFLDKFKDEKPYLKVGMELFYAGGAEIVNEIKKRGHKIFLDLKLHDIPNTVKKAMNVLSNLDVDMTNLHASGGSVMMKYALEGLTREDGTRPLLIGVTQLTSTSQELMTEELLIDKPIDEVVMSYALNAKNAGLGKDFYTVTPGIRLAGDAVGDQKRVTTPALARELGSDYIVVGRSITGAEDPVKAYRQCVKEFLG